MKVLALLLIGFALSSSTPAVFDPNYKAPFPIQFYFDVATKQPTKNLIVSPASVTICMALAYLGAGGKTAQEFHDVLNFPGTTQQEIAQHYGEFVSDVKKKVSERFAFTMANHIFVDQKYGLKPEYNQIAAEYLHAGAENVDFTQNEAAAQKINTWAAEETNNKIQNIVNSKDFDATTAAVLINAVYFKAPWLHPFKTINTHKHDFYLNKNDKIQVDMMKRTGSYEVADWAHIDATAVRIPFAGTDIYMLIVLPNTVDGLADMEEKFKSANHAYMQTTPTPEIIELTLPKFKFEFDISLVTVLKEMGLESMFSNSADFSKLLNTDRKVKVSDVKHKAFINVDEEGTEAAALTVATFEYVTAMLVNPNTRKITVDHPFMFAIRDQRNVYFAGHVVNF